MPAPGTSTLGAAEQLHLPDFYLHCSGSSQGDSSHPERRLDTHLPKCLLVPRPLLFGEQELPADPAVGKRAALQPAPAALGGLSLQQGSLGD